MGNVRLLDNGKHDAYYLAEGNNPAIISKETFQAVQIEKQQRSNVIKGKTEVSEKAKNTVRRSRFRKGSFLYLARCIYEIFLLCK